MSTEQHGTVGRDEEDVWHFALRYALPRKTAASTVVSDFLRKNAGRIRRETRLQMVREIGDAIEDGCAGDAIDVTIWRSLADDLEKENGSPRPMEP